jgi:hypothetical protein
MSELRGELAGAGDIGARPCKVALAQRQSGRQVGRHRIAGDQGQRLVQLGAGAGGVARSHEGAGAIEMDLAAQLRRQARPAQRRIERGQGARGVVGGQPGIAGLRPQIGAARVLGAIRLLRGLLEHAGRAAPILERDIGKAEALARHQAAAAGGPLLGEGQAGARILAHRLRAGGGAALLGLRRGGGGRLQEKSESG